MVWAWLSRRGGVLEEDVGIEHCNFFSSLWGLSRDRAIALWWNLSVGRLGGGSVVVLEKGMV